MFKPALQAFFKKPTTIVGIVTALLFQVIFSVIWMTGYDGVTDHTKELRIAIVNEDAGMGSAVAANLKKNLPFHVATEKKLDEAMEQLDQRDYHMIVHIPADFSQQAQTPGQTGQLAYYINESNPAMIKSVMQGAANTITDMVNKQATAAGIQAAFTRSGVPAEQASAMAEQLPVRVESKFEISNLVSGMNNQMVPMMLVLASYVGSMIMSMNLQQSSNMIGPAFSRWQKFGVRSAINVVSAVVIALIGTSLVQLLGGQAEQGFLAIWSFQTLFLLSFMFFSQIFLFLFGNAGMLFNIMALSAQLVSSGAMVPRDLLPGFYHGLGDYLPATYAVEGNMNLLFGGSGTSASVTALLIITGASVIAGLTAVALRKEKQSHAPVAKEAIA